MLLDSHDFETPNLTKSFDTSILEPRKQLEMNNVILQLYFSEHLIHTLIIDKLFTFLIIMAYNKKKEKKISMIRTEIETNNYSHSLSHHVQFSVTN